MTKTFLFTDIVGSTRRWDRFPSAMRQALDRHDELLRRAVAAHDGHLFKTVGDAVWAAFDSAHDAVLAAVEAQRALVLEDWSAFGADFAPLTIRVGIHTGDAEPREGDYVGPPLHRCARLQAIGHGGQILVSSATRHELAPDQAAPFRLRDLGTHRLRDLTKSEHVYQVLASGVPDVATPLATTDRLHVGDRVSIDPAARPRSVREAMAALRTVVLDKDADVTLSPAQMRALIEHQPSDLDAYRLRCIAEWSQPRHALDGRFVALELLVDKGRESANERWESKEERYDDLGAVLDDVPDPALVLLGPPGAGKSTLLRRFELDTAVRALSRDPSGESGHGQDELITFFVQLNRYRAAAAGSRPPPPGQWLEEEWSTRFRHLPRLTDLLASGRMVLLLDALNEIPALNDDARRGAILQWKMWLRQFVAEFPGNRVVFSCRSLDFSQPLSTHHLRVPQVLIEPMSDDQVLEFLRVYSPAYWRNLWARLSGSQRIEVLRSPYFLKLLTDQVEASGDMPVGRAGLFTGFVRQALRREVEQENPLFVPNGLVSQRDIRRVTHWRWRNPHELPERGALVPALSSMAYRLQKGRPDGELSQVRVDYDTALELLQHDRDEDIIRAGVALSVLDEDVSADEVMYVHQLVQEYFAAREMARTQDASLVRSEWRAEKARPPLEDMLDALAPADRLPGLPQTGWEETALLAAAIVSDAPAFVSSLWEENRVLAARCAAQPDVLPAVPPALVSGMASGLLERIESPEADLRHRMACSRVMSQLGDPRFERHDGPDGEYLMPPLARIDPGHYLIGDDEPIAFSFTGAEGESAAHVPSHTVHIEAFQIGRFPITNAEWSCFMAAEGYDDARWWARPFGRAWQEGHLANEGAKANNRLWRRRFSEDPALLEQMAKEGRFASEAAVERWRNWMQMDEEEFEAALASQWTADRKTAPRFWQDIRFNQSSQPVVGVCWYEARAYCEWLSAQCGKTVRLPTEVEWEAAARGRSARRYSYGDSFVRLAANTAEAHVKQPSPVGVFPNGQTPEGVHDFNGNVAEWTSSLFGAGELDDEVPEFGYPYDPADGRENLEADPAVRRVGRGGAWNAPEPSARSMFRHANVPTARLNNHGFRVVVED